MEMRSANFTEAGRKRKLLNTNASFTRLNLLAVAGLAAAVMFLGGFAFLSRSAATAAAPNHAGALYLDNVALGPYVDLVQNHLLQPLTARVNGPDGPVANAEVVSVNANSNGEPYNFARIYTNGTNTIVTNWSKLHGLIDEVKVATAKTTANGFTNGQVFFGNNGATNRIGYLNPEGTWSNLTFATLTNDTYLRGSLYVDQSGSFGGDLIAVTGDYPNTGGGVWRVRSNGTSVLITNISGTHLEGVITLTNDVTKWGPWAGKIITGAESTSPQPLIYGIASNGLITPFALGIAPEDFEIIPPNQSLYACDPDRNVIIKLSANFFTNFVGDLLVTQAGEGGPAGRLFIVHWDDSTTNFITKGITYIRPDGLNGHLEHVTFAPIEVLPINQ